MGLNILRAHYLLMGLLLTAVCEGSASDEQGLRIVSMAKAASGGAAWDRLEIMHDAGQMILASGEMSRYEHWGDLRNLRTRAGTGGGDMIFDGRVAYKCQTVACDSPTPLNSDFVRGGAYMTCFGFFFPGRFPASFHYEGKSTEGGLVYDIVKVTPTGIASVVLWIDRRSHLVFRLVYGDGRTDLTDYRRVRGVLVPFTETSGEMTVKSESVTFEGDGAVGFSLPAGIRP